MTLNKKLLNNLKVQTSFLESYLENPGNFISKPYCSNNAKVQFLTDYVIGNDFYNDIVNKYNLANRQKQSIELASYLLFILTHCYNGLYRENSQGDFNAAYNWEVKHITKNQITNKLSSLNEIFNMFNIVFSSESFDKLEYIDTCLYYLDPPYLNEKGIENKYNTCSFNYSKQKLLLELIKTKHFIYSNYYSSEIVVLINEILLLVDIEIIERLNLFSSDPTTRSELKQEILVSSKND